MKRRRRRGTAKLLLLAVLGGVTACDGTDLERPAVAQRLARLEIEGPGIELSL